MENNNNQSIIKFKKLKIIEAIKIPMLLIRDGISETLYIGHKLIINGEDVVDKPNFVALQFSIVSLPKDSSIYLIKNYSLFNILGNLSTIVMTLRICQEIQNKNIPNSSDVELRIREIIKEYNNKTKSLFVAELANDENLQKCLKLAMDYIYGKLNIYNSAELKEGVTFKDSIIEYGKQKLDINSFEKQYMNTILLRDYNLNKKISYTPINLEFQNIIEIQREIHQVIENIKSKNFASITLMTPEGEYSSNSLPKEENDTQHCEMKYMLYKHLFLNPAEKKKIEEYYDEKLKQNTNAKGLGGDENNNSGDENKSNSNNGNEVSKQKQNSDHNNNDTTENGGIDIGEKNIVLTIQAPQDEMAIYEQLQKDTNTEGEIEVKETMEKVKNSKDSVEGATYDILLMQSLTKITPPSIISEFEEPENPSDAKEFSIHYISSSDNILHQFDGVNVFEIPVHA